MVSFLVIRRCVAEVGVPILPISPPESMRGIKQPTTGIQTLKINRKRISKSAKANTVQIFVFQVIYTVHNQPLPQTSLVAPLPALCCSQLVHLRNPLLKFLVLALLVAVSLCL
jgi:hypothetical protein